MKIEPKQGFCYHIKKEYFDKVKENDPVNAGRLMDCTNNKQNRPALFVMNDPQNPNIMWMCPGSSKVQQNLSDEHEKYDIELQRKQARADDKEVITLKIHVYDKQWDESTNKFEPMKSAWLLQNLFPVTKEYLNAEHIGKETGKPIQIDQAFLKEVQNATKAILEEERKPINIANRENMFSDRRWEKLFVNTIKLEKMLVQEQKDMKLSQDYQAFADKHPNKAILIETDKNTYALGETAKKLAEAYKIEPKTINTGIDINDKTQIIRLPPGERSIKSAAAMLLKQGEKVTCKKITGETVNYVITKPQKEQLKEQKPPQPTHQQTQQLTTRQPTQGTIASRLADKKTLSATKKQTHEKPPPGRGKPPPDKGDGSR